MFDKRVKIYSLFKYTHNCRVDLNSVITEKLKKLSKLEANNFFFSNYSCKKLNNPKNNKIRTNTTLAAVSGPQPRWIGSNYFNSLKNM